MARVLLLLGTHVWMIPPMTARRLLSFEVPGSGLPKPEEAALAVASLKLLPTGLVGRMVAAVSAATMSSMDLGLARNDAVLMQAVSPLLGRLLGRDVPADRRRLGLARCGSLRMRSIIIGPALVLRPVARMQPSG